MKKLLKRQELRSQCLLHQLNSALNAFSIRKVRPTIARTAFSNQVLVARRHPFQTQNNARAPNFGTLPKVMMVISGRVTGSRKVKASYLIASVLDCILITMTSRAAEAKMSSLMKSVTRKLARKRRPWMLKKEQINRTWPSSYTDCLKV